LDSIKGIRAFPFVVAIVAAVIIALASGIYVVAKVKMRIIFGKIWQGKK